MKMLHQRSKFQSDCALGVIPVKNVTLPMSGKGSRLPGQSGRCSGIGHNAFLKSRSISASIKIFLLVFFLQAACGCMSLVYYEGSYQGQVIDAQTHEPIEGAVVLGVWSKEYMTAGGDVHEYYDARETLTDAKGEFTIKGMGPRAMTHLDKMNIVIFKVGYEDVGLTSWESLESAIYYKDRVKWEGSKAIIPLDKWTLEQRRNRFSVRPVGVPNNKIERLLEEIKKEDNEIR